MLFLLLLAIDVLNGTTEWWRAAQTASTFALFIWPGWLLTSIAVKWIVIGRFKPGRYPLTSNMHVEDLIEVERQLGYHYEMKDPQVEHYQWICPPCRRSMLALAQGRLWRGEPAAFVDPGSLMPKPTFGLCTVTLG